MEEISSGFDGDIWSSLRTTLVSQCVVCVCDVCTNTGMSKTAGVLGRTYRNYCSEFMLTLKTIYIIVGGFPY